MNRAALPWPAWLAAGALLGAACGGSSFSSSEAAGEAGGDGGGTGGSESGAGDGPLSDDGGGPGAGDAPGDSLAEGALLDGPAPDAPASDGPAPGCPSIAGSYALSLTTSVGCGLLSATAPECLRQGVGSCSVELRSNVSGGGPGGVTGTVTLESDGTFRDAALTEGGAMRTGCTGSYEAGTSTLTVDCGGTGTTQSCVVSMTRTSTASCN